MKLVKVCHSAIIASLNAGPDLFLQKQSYALVSAIVFCLQIQLDHHDLQESCYY